MAVGTDALTEQEKEAVRYHMGYLASSTAASLTAGLPKPRQPLFVLEDAILFLTNQYAVARVRSILATLANIEGKMKTALCAIQVEAVNKITLHPLRDRGLLYPDSLEHEYVRWVNRLADILGAPKYAYSERFRRRGPGTVVPVSG